MNAVELSLIIPVKDEEEAIGVFLARVVPVLEKLDDPAARSFEIIFVDDGSSDRTLDLSARRTPATPEFAACRCRAISARKRRFRPGSIARAGWR